MKVFGLNGKEIEAPQPFGASGVVEKLEEYLNLARAGQITAIVIALNMPDCVLVRSAGNWEGGYLAALGATTMMQWDMVKRVQCDE